MIKYVNIQIETDRDEKRGEIYGQEYKLPYMTKYEYAKF